MAAITASQGGRGWRYRRAVTVDNTGNSSALTDYQVRIALTAANFDFAATKSDGSDIRVTAADGTTARSFWIESWDAAAQKAVMWVKVPSVTGLTTNMLYLYYGNHAAAAAASIEDTFIFGDDFGAKPAWNRYVVQNPVLSGDVGAWDEDLVGDPWVEYDTNSSTYRMWYYGKVKNQWITKIGYATSPDGVTWAKSASNPIVSPNGGDTMIGKACHVESGGTHYLFYSADNGVRRALAVATAPAPDGPYTQQSVIMTPNGTYEGSHLDGPCVRWDAEDQIYKMWYSAGTAVTGEPKYWCLATASNLLGPWARYVGNPIASPDDAGNWNSRGLSGMNVTKRNGKYENYYIGVDAAGTSRMGYTESADGVTWAPAKSDLVFDLGHQQWESNKVYRPCVIEVGGTKKMWYNATAGAEEKIGYAEYQSNPVDTNKWGKGAYPGQSYKSSGNVIVPESVGGYVSFEELRSKYIVTADQIVEARVTPISIMDAPGSLGYQSQISALMLRNASNAYHRLWYAGMKQAWPYDWYPAAYVDGTLLSAADYRGAVHHLRIVRRASDHDFYLLDADQNVIASSLGVTAAPVGGTMAIVIGSRGATVSCDWVRVRKYTATEPTTSVGAQAAAPLQPS